MPSLKEYRNRIESVKSTRKITSAMKMVAASKLRLAQEHAESSRPYADRMARMLQTLSANLNTDSTPPKLLVGTGADDRHLLVVVTSDRGLCGGFNGALVREVRGQIKKLLASGKQVQIICVGRKGRDLLRRDYAKLIVEYIDVSGKKRISFAEAQQVAASVLTRFDLGETDVVTLYYNRFKSVIAQVPTGLQLIPVKPDATEVFDAMALGYNALFTFEPSEDQILASLLPRNLTVQIFSAMLESAAGEQAARMAAMDNATRNASEMIAKLTLTYNRVRQAYITKELIEIISGAEAL